MYWRIIRRARASAWRRVDSRSSPSPDPHDQLVSGSEVERLAHRCWDDDATVRVEFRTDLQHQL
jgi:hypothetical protein